MKITPMFKGGVLLASALLLAACNSTSVKRNQAQTFPLSISAQKPAFIFPISLHGVPGNTMEVGLAISSGAVAKYGTSVISGQQLYPMVGNLSWTLGENMRRQANAGKMEMTGSAATYAQQLDSKMKLLTDKLKGMGAIKDANYDFKYVIVLHVDSAGGIPLPGVKQVTAFGGIMDMQSQQIVSYIEKDLSLSDDAILGQMPAEMNAIIAELIDDKA